MVGNRQTMKLFSCILVQICIALGVILLYSPVKWYINEKTLHNCVEWFGIWICMDVHDKIFFKLNIFSIFWSTSLCPVFYLFRSSSCFWGRSVLITLSSTYMVIVNLLTIKHLRACQKLPK